MPCGFFFVAFDTALWLLTIEHLLAHILHVLAVPRTLKVCDIQVVGLAFVIFEYTNHTSVFFVIGRTYTAGVCSTAYPHASIWSGAQMHPGKYTKCITG
jgi:hypothetical protein